MSFNKEYLGEFHEAMKRRAGFPLRLNKASVDNNYIGWSCFGRKGFKLFVSMHQDDDWICVNFGIDSRDQKHHFTTLLEKRVEIEKNIGKELYWELKGNEISNTQAKLTNYNVNIRNRDLWVGQHAWILEHLEKMYFAFKPHVDRLVTD